MGLSSAVVHRTEVVCPLADTSALLLWCVSVWVCRGEDVNTACEQCRPSSSRCRQGRPSRLSPVHFQEEIREWVRAVGVGCWQNTLNDHRTATPYNCSLLHT